MIPFLALVAASAMCVNTSNQYEMNMCAAAQSRAADVALNQQYGAAIAAMRAAERGVDRAHDNRPGYEATLREAQRAWLAFRDAHCRSEGYRMRGGSGEPSAVGLCLATVTRARTKQLHDLANAE